MANSKEEQRACYALLEYQGLCVRCADPAVPNKKKCQKCLDYSNSGAKRKRKEHNSNGMCSKHPTKPHVPGLKTCAECHDRKKDDDLKYRARMKAKVVKEYGKKCRCPGCENPDPGIKFLSIDHINNDGKEHRQKDKKASNIWQWLVQNNYPKEGFQIMCFNCNLGKNANGGVCPHVDPLREWKNRGL